MVTAKMKFIGGTPCLDFVNTVSGWVEVRVAHYAMLRDKLIAPEDLVSFGRLSGLIDAREAANMRRRLDRSPERAQRLLVEASKLRAMMYRVFASAAYGRSPKTSDLRRLEAAIQDARDHQVLVKRSKRFAWHFDDPHAPRRVLWAVLSSAETLLTSPAVARIGRCGGDACGWLFVDDSRNQSRHWCDMKDCGNRAKVRRFRERHR
jgi:predicted RNA-binding Zn ribbon-like protein